MTIHAKIKFNQKSRGGAGPDPSQPFIVTVRHVRLYRTETAGGCVYLKVSVIDALEDKSRSPRLQRRDTGREKGDERSGQK